MRRTVSQADAEFLELVVAANDKVYLSTKKDRAAGRRLLAARLVDPHRLDPERYVVANDSGRTFVENKRNATKPEGC